MQFDMPALAPTQRYELLLGTVLPRPVALVTTLNADGGINSAPYSLFNVMGHDPAIVMLAVLPHVEGRLKDSAANILARREFTVGMVSQDLAAAMNVACIDAPPGVDELALAGLATMPSVKVAPPRVAQCKVSFECVFRTSLSFGPHQLVVAAEVVQAFVDDGHVIDAGQASVDAARLEMIGAMHGARWYARTTDLFAMDRPSWAQWREQGKVKP